MVNIVLCLSLLLSFPVWSKLTVTEQYDYYGVNSDDQSELFNTINLATPIKDLHNIYHGHTEFSVTWDLWFTSSTDFCQVSRTHTQLSITYTLPKLTTNNIQIQYVWQQWYPNLSQHELEHGSLTKLIAAEIDNEILSLASQKKCSQVIEQANLLANNLLDKLKIQNIALDDDTNHGQTQGAWLYDYL